MAFVVFHLASWSKMLQILPASIEAETSGAALRMRRDWRHIWDAFGSGRRTVDDWSLAVLIAARHRDDLTRMRPRRKQIDADSHLGPLDNRIAWHAALPEIDRKMPWFSKFCRVYLSVLDGTPAVERNMGVLKSALEQHQGGGGGDQSYKTLCMVVECRLDGPSTEEDVVHRAGELLRLTPLSKEFAAEWVQRNGRRFCTYKKRKDAGMTKVKKKGTMISVIHRQHAAVDALVESSRRSNQASTRGEVHGEIAGTVLPGVHRDELVQAIARARQTERPVNRGQTNFQKETQRTLRMKRSVATWAGERPGPVKLRRKGEKESAEASAPPRGDFSVPREISREDFLSVASDEASTRRPGERDGYANLPTNQIAKASAFRIRSLQDLSTGRASTSKLLVWMHAIAKGLPLQETNAPCGLCRHEPSSELVPAVLHCTDDFRKNSSRLTTALEEICRKPTCVWKMVARPLRNGRVIKTDNDMRIFLLAVRRLEGTRLATRYPPRKT